MKISLIVPPFKLLEEGYGTKIKIKKGNLPNLGICYIAACLKKANHDVQIIDAEASKFSNSEIIRRVKDFNSDAIGITITNAHYNSAKKLIHKIGDEFSGKIIFGGPHASCFPYDIMKENPKIDFIVFGEGEVTIVDLVDAIEKNKNFKYVKGIFYRLNGKIIMTPSRDIIKNLDDIPMPAFDLLDMSLYSPLPDQYKRLPAISYLSSRGCTWKKCTFCFESSVKSQIYRRHSPERVVKDIKYLQERYGIKEIDFLDDEFFINEMWIERFCNLLKEEKIDLSWSAYGRVDHVTKNMFVLAKEVGCWSVFFGIESGNQDLLEIVNKGITLEQVKTACKWAKEAGLEIRGSFMLGLPGENPRKAQITIDFTKELDLDTAAFHLTYPEYGTKLYDIAIKQGRFINKDEWTKRTRVSYLPLGYKNPKQLEKMQKKAFREFYFRPYYIIKRLKKIKSLEDIKRNYEGLKFLLGIV